MADLVRIGTLAPDENEPSVMFHGWLNLTETEWRVKVVFNTRKLKDVFPDWIVFIGPHDKEATTEAGALWDKTSAKGSYYLSGTIKIAGAAMSVIVWVDQKTGVWTVNRRLDDKE